jgi:hypothetical protein
MNKALRVATLASFLAMSAMPALTIQGLACTNPFGGGCAGGGNYSGAPGPLLGAGLPFLGLVGGGVYWIVRRFRRKGD